MHNFARRAVIVVIALLVPGACGESTPGVGNDPRDDGGTTGDAGRTTGDAGDAGPSEGGLTDSGTRDAATSDAARDAAGGRGGAAGSGGIADSGAAGGAGGGSAGAGGTSSDGGGATGDIIAAPNGIDAAPGTLTQPTTLTAAITRVAAGNTIRLRGGTYAYAVQITIEAKNSGLLNQRKAIAPYANEKPILDFGAQPYGTGTNPRGLEIDGNFWHVIGLEVKGSADNGMYVAGSDNIVERCTLHDNRDSGLQIGRATSATTKDAWPANNLVLNSESYDNYDAPPGGGENADGFAAKLTVGPGNVFRGCVSHHNIDDGWDLYTKTDTGAISPVTIDQCVAHHNGTLTNGTSNPNGDRNGFKLGGEDIAVAHVVSRSIAFANGKNGFTWNSNPGEIHVLNCLAFDNAQGNYRFGDNATPTAAVFTNNISFFTGSGAVSDKTVGTDVANTNCWWDTSKSAPSTNGKGLVVTSADFVSPLAQALVNRQPDGKLVFTPFLLAPGSDLLNAGAVPSGPLPFDATTYYMGLPDLGAVESAP